MSASTPSSRRGSAENELLAQLGLPPSATPEDIDQAHLAVSQFLAAAPAGLRAWARVQAGALDEAYLQLTDPVGLEGSALRSPTRPPTVVPGGPATPPARRDSVPAMTTAAALAAAQVADAPDPRPETAEEADAADDTDTDDLDALFASVTPGAHRDMVSGGKPAATVPHQPAPTHAAPAAKAVTARRKASRQGAPAQALIAPASAGRDPWKAVAIVASVGLLVAVLAFVVVPFVYNLGNAGTAGAANSPAASDGTAIDQAQVAALMQKITTNPKDTASLQQLGDIYYGAQDYADAAGFYDKVLAIDPKNVTALMARGAVYYNTGDAPNAKASWDKVLAIDPKNAEAHWDLGFLAMNQASPDWATVQSEWQLVIKLAPGSNFAQSAQQHLDALVAASMLPGPSGSTGPSGAPAASGSATPAGSAAPSGSAAASGASASPASSPAASAQPSASSATSPAASASTAP